MAASGLEFNSTLRFTTAGSVDDGKSTLIGRLLLDAKGLLEDQLAAVARTTARRGSAGLDLAPVSYTHLTLPTNREV